MPGLVPGITETRIKAPKCSDLRVTDNRGAPLAVASTSIGPKPKPNQFNEFSILVYRNGDLLHDFEENVADFIS